MTATTSTTSAPLRSSEFPIEPPPVSTQHLAATVLARAFVEDPLFVTVLRDPVRRAAALPLVFRAMAHQTARQGLIDIDAEGRGAALWVRDEGGAIGPVEVVRHGYLRVAVTAGIVDALRLSAVQSSIAAHHHDLLPEPHGYVYALGVDPAFQGQGIGSGLLTRGCERLDELGLPGYLETNLPQNVRLYERHGFRVARHLPATAAKAFDTWLMIRPGQ